MLLTKKINKTENPFSLQDDERVVTILKNPNHNLQFWQSLKAILIIPKKVFVGSAI